MGEATYYIQAKFESEAQAEKIFRQFEALNRQGVKAHDYWQAHRDVKDRDAFFTAFNKRFPLVAEYLGEHQLDHNNGLAGKLDFIDDGESGKIDVENNTIHGSAYVWHFADWSLLEAWLKKRGATKVVTLSDEYTSIGDLLPFAFDKL